MKKKEKFIKTCDLSVSHVLLGFVNKELLPGTGISSNQFWKGFSKTVHDLSPKNKKLLETREKIQKSIDSFHLERKEKKFNFNEYKIFLQKTGYLKKSGPNFKIETKNEIGRASCRERV